MQALTDGRRKPKTLRSPHGMESWTPRHAMAVSLPSLFRRSSMLSSTAYANCRSSACTCTIPYDFGLGFNLEAHKPRMDDDHGPALEEECLWKKFKMLLKSEKKWRWTIKPSINAKWSHSHEIEQNCKLPRKTAQTRVVLEPAWAGFNISESNWMTPWVCRRTGRQGQD